MVITLLFEDLQDNSMKIRNLVVKTLFYIHIYKSVFI